MEWRRGFKRGSFVLYDGGVIIGHNRGESDEQAIAFRGDTESMEFYGKVGYSGTRSALLMDQAGTFSAMTTVSATVTYGNTYDTNPYPIAVLNDTPVDGDFGCALNVHTRTTSSFQIRGTSATNGTWSVIYWAFRH